MPASGPPTHAELVRAIRAHHAGVLVGELAGEEAAWPISLAIDGPTGRLIGNATHEALGVESLGLSVGEETEDCPQIHTSLDPIDPDRDAASDRYMARFGEPDGRLCHLRIHAAKWLSEVYDGDAIDLTNPLASRESSLLRKLNSDRSILAVAVERERRHRPPDATAVGIDPDGLDLRLGHHIVRIDADIGDDPERWVKEWLTP